MRPTSSSLICPRNASTPCASMTAKVTPSTPGAPSFFLASAYASRSVSILQTWTYKPQKRQDVSAFALTYSLRLRSCKSMDAFVISSLPSRLRETLRTEGPPRSAGVTPLLRYYGPIRHPLAFDRLPGWAGYTIYLAPVISHRGEEGFASYSVCPRHRAVAFTPPRWHAASVRFRHPILPSPSGSGLGPRIWLFEATFAFTVVT